MPLIKMPDWKKGMRKEEIVYITLKGRKREKYTNSQRSKDAWKG